MGSLRMTLPAIISFVQAAQATKKDYGLKHLAVIMDGNRRWAKSKNLPSLEGHRAGVVALRKLVEVCPDYGIKHLTAYTFSTENWNRKETEINFLLQLLGEVAVKELNNLNKENVKVDFLGDLNAFKESKLYSVLIDLKTLTANNTGLNLHIALNYGSIDELKQAKEKIQEELNTEEIKKLDEKLFNTYLYTAHVPYPEVVLRTGGEKRLSNYLLWQAADSELQFIDTLWPDFSEEHLVECLVSLRGVAQPRRGNPV